MAPGNASGFAHGDRPMETIQVEIFGQTYALKGGNDPQRVRDLAAYLNARMKDVQKSTGISDGYRVAILTALNIADELHRLRSQQDVLQKATVKSIDRLLDLTRESAAPE
jgi:cell division protein ZapA